MWRRASPLLLVLALGSGLARAEDPAGPGWTGLTSPKDVIAARQSIMAELERLMRPIDTFAAGQAGEPADLRTAAAAIPPLLLAAPHLFPPTTNLYDAAEAEPATLALPAIWESFPTFYALAAASSTAATKMVRAAEPQALRIAGRELRATCDACHTPYLRPYVAAGVSEADLEFDFDSVLPQ